MGVRADEKKEEKNSLKLTPRLHKEITAFLSTDKVFELMHALGSPLNILFPDLLEANVGGFRGVFNRHGLSGRIYFAHKANRADAIPRKLATTDAYIDVSSINELRHALGSGFDASRVQATGPKNTEFLHLCLQHNVVISVDSVQELQTLKELRRAMGLKTKSRVLLRISGFKNRQQKHQGKSSRFGIRFDRVREALALLTEVSNEITLLGFAFHLDTVSSLEKAVALESCLQLIEEAIDLDFNPTVINIGGGFKVNYIENSMEWSNYTSAMREAALGSRTPFTWQGNTFGLYPDKGVLRGSFNSYSFYDSSAGPAFLDEILSHQLESTNSSIANFLRENGIDLWIEPGRAILDQVGITVARVNSLKESSTGDVLVCLNMKRQDVCFLDQEIFLDPIVLYQRNRPAEDAETGVYFAGNLCLESDLVTRHQTMLPSLPEPGDLVVFANTAGYFMDFSASEAIMHPIAKKVAVSKQNNSSFNWCLDENYYPEFGKGKEG
ncbi:MAG TPA: Y4yA family PLP-dependent enzyme [Planktothrix sp.]|jgi:diaminopimelate decarboxylase